MKRRVDGQGRICLPADARSEFNLVEGSYVEVEPIGNSIVITMPYDVCSLCEKPLEGFGYKSANHNKRMICSSCYSSLSKVNLNEEETENE